MKTKKFYGKVDGYGKLVIDYEQAFRNYKEFFKGKEIQLTLETREKETTWGQYKFMYGVLIPLIAEHTGDRKEAVEHQIKERWHSELGKMMDWKTGEMVNVLILGSFARGNITRKKFAEVIKMVEDLCVELDILFPNQDEWLKQNEGWSYA
jgi:hypothetical protein